jgi:hypothetical protein
MQIGVVKTRSVRWCRAGCASVFGLGFSMESCKSMGKEGNTAEREHTRCMSTSCNLALAPAWVCAQFLLAPGMKDDESESQDHRKRSNVRESDQ